MTNSRQVSPDTNNFSNSVERSIAVVEFLAAHPRETFSLSEIARRCGIPKPTAHKILGTLQARGWVSRSTVDLRYGLGPTLILIGHTAGEVRPEVNLARPIMEELATEFRCECMLSTAVSDEILILESTGSVEHRVGSSFRSGAQTPLVAPFGACFIAWQSPDEWHEWYARSGLSDPHLIEQMDAILNVTVERGLRRHTPHRLPGPSGGSRETHAQGPHGAADPRLPDAASRGPVAGRLPRRWQHRTPRNVHG